MISKMKLWVYAARPKTLFIGVSPILIGTCMAIKEKHFNLSIFLWTLLGALMIQIGTNYCNDYFDFLKGADQQNRKGLKKVLPLGLITPQAMKIAFILCFSFAAICTFVLMQRGGLILLLVGAICILFSILYTAPPFPLAYLGLGDLFVLVFYGPVATLFCYYLQTLHFSYPVFLASLAPGLLGLGPLNINNLRDHDEDIAAGKKTLVVRFGVLFGKIHFLLVLLACFCVPPLLVFYTKAHFFCLLGSLALLKAIPLIKSVFTYEDPAELNSIFIKTAKLIPLYTLLFCLGYLI
jgi:1,4-dihydroxy-2-naphthoate polyprenyltransferase